MLLTITYTNGSTLTQSVNYAVLQNSELIFSVHKNPTPAYCRPVHVPLTNLTSVSIDPNDDRPNVYRSTPTR